MKHAPKMGYIQVEMVRQALRLAPIGVPATIVNASILAVVLWPSVSHLSLIVWLVASLALAFLRLSFLYKNNPELLHPETAVRTAGLFIAGVGLAGAIWGCVAVFLFPVGSPPLQTLIVIAICGMTAGAAETLAPILLAFIAFSLPALGPLVFRFVSMGGPIYLAMAAMTLLYMVLTLLVAIRINRTNRTLIQLKEHFVGVAEERAAANERLQEEIAERRRMEDSLRDSERRLRVLSSRLITAQEEERRRISRELHDSVGASLSAAKFSMENVIDQMKSGNSDLKPVNYSIRAMQLAIEEVRRTVMDLRPSILDDYGIIATLKWLCRQFQAVHTDVAVEVQVEPEENDIPEPLKITIFRIVQEALNNIAKYSEAKRVKLSVAKTGDSLFLSVEDNGVGFDLKSGHVINRKNNGLGLLSMKERAELSGGVFIIESEIGKGTRVVAHWNISSSFSTA